MTKFFFCVFFSIVLITGCGERAEENAIEKKIEKATGAEADVDLSKKGIKITGETDGGKYTVTTGEETEIPKDFPDDVFIYRPSKAIMATKIPEGYSIALTTRDNQSKVLGAYRQEMKAKGWSEETCMSMGPQSVLVYEKNGRAANISIVTSDNALQINVTVTTK
jgi:hypothetical protein